jgi:hypothetical protein
MLLLLYLLSPCLFSRAIPATTKTTLGNKVALAHLSCHLKICDNNIVTQVQISNPARLTCSSDISYFRLMMAVSLLFRRPAQWWRQEFHDKGAKFIQAD